MVTWYKSATRVKSWDPTMTRGTLSRIKQKPVSVAHTPISLLLLVAFLTFPLKIKHVGPFYSWNYTPQSKHKLIFKKKMSPVSDWTPSGPHLLTNLRKKQKISGAHLKPTRMVDACTVIGFLWGPLLAKVQTPSPRPRRTFNAIRPGT